MLTLQLGKQDTESRRKAKLLKSKEADKDNINDKRLMVLDEADLDAGPLCEKRLRQ